jgi:hypothetical protein
MKKTHRSECKSRRYLGLITVVSNVGVGLWVLVHEVLIGLKNMKENLY